MWFSILKVVVSAILIAIISEISKRSSLLGGVLASISLVSILSFIWLYVETKDVGKVAELSNSIVWLIIPSISFFYLLPSDVEEIQFHNINGWLIGGHDSHLPDHCRSVIKIWN